MTSDPMLLQEAAPSLLGAALRAGGMVIGLAALAVGWMLWQRRNRRSERRMKVEDRLVLNRAASVVLMQVDDQRLLVGVSPEGIRLLRTLPPPTEHPSEAPLFADVLQQVAEPAEATS